MGSHESKPGPLVAPLLLRIVVGATFVWAGLGKLVPIIEYKGQDAAVLANLGTGIAPTVSARPSPGATAAPSLAPPATLPLPEGQPNNKPASPPKGKPTSRQPRQSPDIASTAATAPALASLAVDPLPAAADTARAKARPTSAKGKAQPPIAPPPGTQPPAATPAGGSTPAGSSLVQPPAVPTAPPHAPAVAQETLPPGGKFTAADFPEPARARRAYSLCVMMVRAAYPQPSIGVANPKPYWPSMFATSPWVVWLAFGVSVTELFAGVMLLVGFLTRLSALMLVGVMATALWLTQIGPAMSIGQTSFWFLPDKTWWDPQVWTLFLWQVLIIASGIAIACLGAGALSVDRALAVIGSGGPKAEQDPSAKG